MSPEDEIGKLPLAYAVALRLDAAGASNDVIADALGIEPDAVAGVLDVARRKLQERLDRGGTAPST